MPGASMGTNSVSQVRFFVGSGCRYCWLTARHFDMQGNTVRRRFTDDVSKVRRSSVFGQGDRQRSWERH